MSDFKQQLEDLLLAAGQNDASDIHLSPGNYPILRIDGRLIPLSNKKILDSESLEGLALVLLGEERKARFVSEKEIDFSYESSQGTRFRVNVYYTQGRIAATLRLVPNQIKSIEDLNLRSIIKVFAKLSQGFV